jgi:hypothetical protein
MMEVEIKSLTGKADRIQVSEGQTVGSLRRHVQAKWQSLYVLKLFLRVRADIRELPELLMLSVLPSDQHSVRAQGIPVSDKTPLSELAVGPGEFLVNYSTLFHLNSTTY